MQEVHFRINLCASEGTGGDVFKFGNTESRDRLCIKRQPTIIPNVANFLDDSYYSVVSLHGLFMIFCT